MNRITSLGRNILQGPEMIQATHALQQERASKQQWPFPWSYPPPGATRVLAGANAAGTIVTPTQAQPAVQGLLYTVDEGFQFAFTHLVVLHLNATTSIAGAPGAFTWSLDVNLPVGVATYQGSPIQGFANVDVPLGSLTRPWQLEMPEMFQPADAIRSKFVNVSVAVGAPNYFKTILLGWKWPVA
jgi:hypothetical protein